MGLVDHAKTELEAVGLFDEDSDYNGMLGQAALELIAVFAKQGHSGYSAGIVSDLFDKLSRYEPLKPLTGEDSEWIEVADDLFQNKRCIHVFKDSNGAYDLQGKVFVEPNGCGYTSRESRVPVTFPYTPKTEYVNVEESLS